MDAVAPLVILVPLIGALVMMLMPRGRWSGPLVVAVVIVELVVAAMLPLLVWSAGSVRHAVGGWAAPLGIELRIDGLAAIMSFTTALVVVPVTAYAAMTRPPATDARWRADDAFWPCWLFLLGALQALYLSADIFNVYVTLEMLTIASIALVVLAGTAEARRAAMRYLVAAFLGSMAFLMAVALLYAESQTLDMQLIGVRLAAGPVAWAAIALATTGIAIKGALLPLHYWLPRAHANAPPPVSAMLSGFVVAAAFYILLRLWFEAAPHVVTPAASQLVGALGGAAIIWGSIQAIRQDRLKVMIAYSTVAQVGYFFLIVPLAFAPSAPAGAALDAWRGGIYLVVAHACAKAAMFLAAGTIARSLGHDRLHGISGIATHLPLSTYAFGIAGMSLIGLPPSGGFIGKWLLLSSSIASGQWWWTLVIIVGGILTAGYVFLVLGQELSQAESDHRPTMQRVPRPLEYTAMALAILALLLGIRAIEPLELLRLGSPFETIPMVQP